MAQAVGGGRQRRLPGGGAMGTACAKTKSSVSGKLEPSPYSNFNIIVYSLNCWSVSKQ